MKTWIHNNYPTTQLRQKQRSITVNVHKLVCLAFHGYPKINQEVRHLDGVPVNIKPSNLRWGTRKENTEDTIRLGSQRGMKNNRAKLNDNKVQLILHKLKSGISNVDIAMEFNIDPSVISHIKRRKIWRHIK